MTGDVAVQDPVSDPQHGGGEGGGRKGQKYTYPTILHVLLSPPCSPSLPPFFLCYPPIPSSQWPSVCTTRHFSVITYSQWISLHMCFLHFL